MGRVHLAHLIVGTAGLISGWWLSALAELPQTAAPSKPPEAALACPSRTERKVVTLASAPNTWGSPVPGSSGTFEYCDGAKGTLTGRVALRGLPPGQLYALSLNESRGHPSAQWLPDEKHGERYFDLEQIPAGPEGMVGHSFSARLPPGAYRVKFFVKEATHWKVVLFNDLVAFDVR